MTVTTRVPRADLVAYAGIALVFIWQLGLFQGVNSPEIDPTRLGYVEMLRTRLFDFVWFDGLKPPVTYFIHAVLIQVFGGDAFLSGTSPFVAIAVLNAVGLGMLYHSARLLGANGYVAATAVTGLAVMLGQLSFWRLGAHYDHLSFSLTAVLIWTMLSFVRVPGLTKAVILGAAGALVVLHNTVFAAVVPVCLTLLWLGWRASGSRGFLAAWAIAILMPFAAGLAVSAKTYATSGIFAPSTLGGLANILVSLRTVDRQPEALRATAVEIGLPDWWLWCYDNAIPIGPPDASALNAEIFRATSTAAGFCTSFAPFEAEHWPLDLIALRAAMESFGDPEPIAAIDADIRLTTQDRLQQMGFAPELKLRWVELYTSKAAELHAAHRTANPSLYLSTYAQLAEAYAISEGPRFPAMVWATIGAYRDSLPGQAMIGLTWTMGTIMQIISPLLLLFATWRLFVGLPIRLLRRSQIAGEGFRFAAQTALGAALLVQLVLFSTQVGEENARYYVYALPYAVLLALTFAPWRERI